MQLPDPSPSMGPHKADMTPADVHSTPQMYVRLVITLSYDRPEVPTGTPGAALLEPGTVLGNAHLQDELDRCGRAVKRAVQKALLDDMLAARLGGTPTIMAICMHQAETVSELTTGLYGPRTVQLPNWEDLPEEYREQLRQAGREMFKQKGVEAYQRRPSPRDSDHVYHEPRTYEGGATAAQEILDGKRNTLPRGPAQPGDLGYRKPHVLDRMHVDYDVPPNAGSAS